MPHTSKINTNNTNLDSILQIVNNLQPKPFDLEMVNLIITDSYQGNYSFNYIGFLTIENNKIIYKELGPVDSFSQLGTYNNHSVIIPVIKNSVFICIPAITNQGSFIISNIDESIDQYFFSQSYTNSLRPSIDYSILIGKITDNAKIIIDGSLGESQ